MVARTSSDPPLSFVAAGSAAEVLRAAAEHLVVCERAGRPHEMCEALLLLAHCWRAQGGLCQAEAHLEQALRWSRLLGSADAVVDILCELAETTVMAAEALEHQAAGSGSAARARARAHTQEAAQLAAQVADPRWEIQVLLRVSEVLGRCGDRSEAALLQMRAMRLMAWEVTAPMGVGVGVEPG